MPTMSWFEYFPEQMMRGVHDLDTHTFKLMLTNTAPVATNTIKSNITEISAGNGYSAGGAVTTVTLSRTTTVTRIIASDVTFSAAGGNIGPFRYGVLYNDSAASDNLVAWLDYGSSHTITSGLSFTFDLDPVLGIAEVRL